MKVASRHLGIKKARIEMLPLIDIVFLLLIFFIYAMLSMVVHHSLPVSLPVSSIAEIDTEQSLTVSVHQNGEIFLDKPPFMNTYKAVVLTRGGKNKVLTSFFFTEKECVG